MKAKFKRTGDRWLRWLKICPRELISRRSGEISGDGARAFREDKRFGIKELSEILHDNIVYKSKKTLPEV